MRTLTVLLLGISCLLSAAPASAGDAVAGTKPLPLPNCPVMDEPIDFTVSTSTAQGPVYFCCQGCIKRFNADPHKYAARVATQRKALAPRPKIQVTCPISGDPVKSSAVIEHQGQKLKFCCNDCAAKFQSNPEKYASGLANSYTYQTRCPVVDSEIDPAAFSVLPTGQKIYLCCKGCGSKLMKNPSKYAPRLAAQGVNIDVKKILQAGKSG